MKCPLIVAAVALIATAGCRVIKVCNSDGGMEITQSEGVAAEIRSSDVCFSEGLSVEKTVLVRNKLGFLTSTVTVRNRHGDPDDAGREDAFAFRYRFVWLDANGAEVLPGASIWRVVALGGGMSKPISDTAPSRKAVSCVLRFSHSR